jgi:hypothetical protein
MPKSTPPPISTAVEKVWKNNHGVGRLNLTFQMGRSSITPEANATQLLEE